MAYSAIGEFWFEFSSKSSILRLTNYFQLKWCLVKSSCYIVLCSQLDDDEVSGEGEKTVEVTDLAMLLRSEREKEQKGEVLAPDVTVSDGGMRLIMLHSILYNILWSEYKL